MDKLWKGLLFVAMVSLAAAGCGGSSSSTPASDTATLSLSFTENNSQVLTSVSKSLSGANIAKATDFSTFSVKCADGAGNVYSGTIDAAGAASLTGIPKDTPLVCFLLNSSGTPVTQLTLSDSSVLGSQYDAPKLSDSSSMSVAYNSLAQGAVVTPDAHAAPNVAAATVVDPTGSYAMDCQSVLNSVTGVEDASYTSTYCANFEAQGNTNVYLHMISGTQSGSNIFAIGAWRSFAAYEECGSTEAISSDMLPTGLGVTTSGQDSAPSWDDYFANFTQSSTTDEIADMIANFGDNTAGLSVAYTAFENLTQEQNGACFWMDNIPGMTTAWKKRMCASIYYWSIMFQYLFHNPAVACLPVLEVDWTNTNDTPDVTMTAKAGLAGRVIPINRFDFMPIQFLSDASGNPIGRMSSKQFWRFDAYDRDTQASVDCIKSESMLVEFAIPTTQPVAGTEVSTRFSNTTSVSSASGNANETTLCQRMGGGGDSSFAPNGYDMIVKMTKQ